MNHESDLDNALATLHDASLLALSVDWLKREVVVRVMSNDDEPARERVLVARGLAWFTMNEPTIDVARRYTYTPEGGPMLDVGLGMHGVGAPTALAASAALVMTIFVPSWNSFIWIGAASFTVEDAPPSPVA